MTTASLSIAEIATYIPASIDIFEKYRIDFYAKGQRTLQEVCRERSLEYALVESEINSVQGDVGKGADIYEWSISRLVSHIQYRYHSSERSSLVFIERMMNELLNKGVSPVLEDVMQVFAMLVAELQEHSNEEENELFPYLRKLEELKSTRSRATELRFALHRPIGILEAEHERAGELLSQIRALTNNYAGSGSKEYNELMRELAEFQKDFHIHIHLENNVLFPKALELESELREMMR